MQLLAAVLLTCIGFYWIKEGFSLTWMQYFGIVTVMWGYGVWLDVLNRNIVKEKK